MMISPEGYYEVSLKGKSQAEILKEIRTLKREIKGLQNNTGPVIRFTNLVESFRSLPDYCFAQLIAGSAGDVKRDRGASPTSTRSVCLDTDTARTVTPSTVKRDAPPLVLARGHSS